MPFLAEGERPALPLGRSVLAMDGAAAVPAQAALKGLISVHLKQAGPSKQGRKGFLVQDSDPEGWSLHSWPEILNSTQSGPRAGRGAAVGRRAQGSSLKAMPGGEVLAQRPLALLLAPILKL